MAHEISATLHTKDVAAKDLEVEIKAGVRDGKMSKLGKLLISRGSIEWKRAGGRGTFELSWDAFATVMEAKGKFNKPPKKLAKKG